MPEVRVILPRMLADVLGEETLRVEAGTIAEALEAAYGRIPSLRYHLCDESGGFRTHVLCVHNGVSTREKPGGLGGRVGDGDEIRIVQAISGG